MGIVDIFNEISGQRLIPNKNWNRLLNRLREVDPIDATRALGHYVASVSLENVGGEHFYETAETFVAAAEPPMTEEEKASFMGAFMIQESIDVASKLVYGELYQQREPEGAKQ
ncbi:MAG TPA: hypothetical protein VLG37_02500 [Candidatus Saccharimonadales bacterium]|nr:hypothetical protein [Candidatus Saccharimonadales bacterium]